MTMAIGQIICWSTSSVPAGFVVCDGTNGTPDLRGRFIFGKTADGDTPLTGGSQVHVHTTGAVTGASDHNHSISGTSTTSSVGVANGVSVAGNAPHSHSLSVTTGNGGAHGHTANLTPANHLPYYVQLYYIMKVY